LSAPRVGLVGARRRRQGLGPFVARDLVRAGATVPCVLGTREETVDAARRALEESYGIVARGYVDVAEMLARESLDALAILSPAETHEAQLRSALGAGLHALCEKPLLWGGEGLAKRSADLVEQFRERELLLRENCQWPYTLDAFRRLHPDARDEPPTRFFMHLTPVSTGANRLGDALPHPLSLLQALAPGDDARVEHPRFAAGPEGRGGVNVAFTYRAGGAVVEAEVALVPSETLPREAAYAVNGRRAERRVRLADYSMRFASGSRSVEVEDPLDLLVADFVQDLRAVVAGGDPPGDPGIVRRMEMLEALVRAWEHSNEH
jgi:hypothetical protein